MARSSCRRAHADRYADGSLAVYLAFIATLVGYGIWGSLRSGGNRRVAPLSLLLV